MSSAIAAALDLPPVRWLELQTQEVFFRLRPAVAPPSDIVILAIDDDSLARGRDTSEPELAPIRTFPWRRTAYATAIDKLMQAGAASVAVDVVLDSPSSTPEDDDRLRQTLQRYAGRVTLAALHTPSNSDGGQLEQFVFPAPTLQTTPQSIGLINYLPEVNGQWRRLSNVYQPFIAPDLWKSQENLKFFDEASLEASRRSFATKGDYIHFYGKQTKFLTLSFWFVLDSENWSRLQQQQVFKDKIVLIGPTAPLLRDIVSTPFGDMPGIEVHANAIATRLENRAIADAVPSPIGRGILLLGGIATVGLGLRRVSKRAISCVLWSLGLAAAWMGISYSSFVYAGLILPAAVPTLAIVLSGLSYLSTGAISNQLEKLRLRRTLERYMAPAIVQEILAQPEDFRALMQGRKLAAAVLFCDIRGFTSLSYGLPADQLIAQLNEYLNAMVQAIVAAGGTVDKFIGDAVMAEFGVPVSQGKATDALNAIRAALMMRTALSTLRQQWQQAGKPPLFHGIGISFGDVIVGNIGSLQRLEYTAIGDTVNVASRVESLTKHLWTDILITQALYTLVEEQIEVVFVGEHPLRGREEDPTRLYSVIGLKHEDPRQYQQVHEALRRHLSKKSDD